MVDPQKFASRKFILTLLGLGGYLIYGFLHNVPIEPIGLSVIIATYGFLNLKDGGNGDV